MRLGIRWKMIYDGGKDLTRISWEAITRVVIMFVVALPLVQTRT